jgi:hypothetical protein
MCVYSEDKSELGADGRRLAVVFTASSPSAAAAAHSTHSRATTPHTTTPITLSPLPTSPSLSHTHIWARAQASAVCGAVYGALLSGVWGLAGECVCVVRLAHYISQREGKRGHTKSFTPHTTHTTPHTSHTTHTTPHTTHTSHTTPHTTHTLADSSWLQARHSSRPSPRSTGIQRDMLQETASEILGGVCVSMCVCLYVCVFICVCTCANCISVYVSSCVCDCVWEYVYVRLCLCVCVCAILRLQNQLKRGRIDALAAARLGLDCQQPQRVGCTRASDRGHGGRGNGSTAGVCVCVCVCV